MNGERKAVYWDACCFISLINRDSTRDPTRANLDTIYNDANARGVLIVTSTLSIVEVNHTLTEQRGQPLDGNAIRDINSIMFNRQAVQLIDFVLPTAGKARELIRDALAPAYGWSLRTADAIHLASAVYYQTVNREPVQQIHT